LRLRLPFGVACGAFLLLEPSAARARDPELGRAFEQARIGVAPVVFSGSWIEGEGSRQRYSGFAGDLHLSVARAFGRWLGLTLDLAGLPPIPSELREFGYFRGDVGPTFQLGLWPGALPGSVLVYGVLGGDTGRYPYRGRFYPLVGGRLRVWPARSVFLQIDLGGAPAAVGPALRTRELRAELSTGVSLLTLALEASWIFAEGGTPSRDYFHQQLGLLVGIGIM
jgi:hypothetical protein